MGFLFEVVSRGLFPSRSGGKGFCTLSPPQVCPPNLVLERRGPFTGPRGLCGPSPEQSQERALSDRAAGCRCSCRNSCPRPQDPGCQSFFRANVTEKVANERCWEQKSWSENHFQRCSEIIGLEEMLAPPGLSRALRDRGLPIRGPGSSMSLGELGARAPSTQKRTVTNFSQEMAAPVFGFLVLLYHRPQRASQRF